MVELLSPVGDFECLKSAVQNGTDAVYFGANLFSARAYAENFDEIQLENAINYAKLRGVKTHLTLNTLIKNEEFTEAFNIAKKAYEYGIDAIIVQDLGLATNLIKCFPDLDIHASTQMTTTNLEEVKVLENLGFKRVVLSREVSLPEIEHICKNTNIEVEVFVHGALCISYSGQCLFSSMVGGRSGNCGKCAQPCRLPYSLYNDTKIIDKGYLLSTRDLCTLEILPNLIKAGVSSFKIEGRMKSPIYVATVTRIYKKYIDLAEKYINKEIKNYVIDSKDKNDLLQVFNRGGFSTGHLLEEPNKNLIFKDKPNNMGFYIGKVLKFNKNKSLITVKLENDISLGDSITFDNETSKYTISELMKDNENIKYAKIGETVTIGRMKGNINLKNKIYKITSKELSENALNSFKKEYRKTSLYCSLKIKCNKKIEVYVKSNYFNIETNFTYDYIPETAETQPLSIEKIIQQFNKTQNTCFEFSNINIDLHDKVFIPTSVLNDIRRACIVQIENKIISSFKRKMYKIDIFNDINLHNSFKYKTRSILLNTLNLSFDYTKLEKVDKIYIPLKYFNDKKFFNILNTLSKKSKLYIYMPIIVKDSYISIIQSYVDFAINNFNISGIVISNLSELSFIKNKDIDLIANYTFNIYNSYTAKDLFDLGFSTISVSPEIQYANISNYDEVIVYGRIALMSMNYCLIGKSNKCYKNCTQNCTSSNNFFIKDRYNCNFRVIPDKLQTITTIYNSKNISLNLSILNCYSIRYDFLDENIEDINSILLSK